MKSCQKYTFSTSFFWSTVSHAGLRSFKITPDTFFTLCPSSIIIIGLIVFLCHSNSDQFSLRKFHLRKYSFFSRHNYEWTRDIQVLNRKFLRCWASNLASSAFEFEFNQVTLSAQLRSLGFKFQIRVGLSKKLATSSNKKGQILQEEHQLPSQISKLFINETDLLSDEYKINQ